MHRPVVIALLAGLLAASCQKGEKKPPAAGAGEPAAAAADSPIGIEICDRYLRRGATCIDQMPAETRPIERDRLARVRADWQQLRSSPSGRNELQRRCSRLYQAAVTTADRLCPGVY